MYMEDSRIVDLYWSRSENAITEAMTKYGKYCYTIAFNILANEEDADESVNDTYMGAWNSMPPHRPSVLSTFLGKITCRLSIDKWRTRIADKRGNGEYIEINGNFDYGRGLIYLYGEADDGSAFCTVKDGQLDKLKTNETSLTYTWKGTEYDTKFRWCEEDGAIYVYSTQKEPASYAFWLRVCIVERFGCLK